MTDVFEIMDKRVVWTPERLETVKEMWATGATAQQIADQFLDVTRNKICGLVHRNKFSRSESAVKPVVEAQPKPAAAPKGNRQRAQRIIGKTAQPLPEIVCEPVELESLHLTIDQLEDHHCRWPELGWEGFGGPVVQTYCGLQVKRDRPYCSGHCLRAFTPIEPKARPIRDAELKQGRGGIFGLGRSA